MPKPQFPQLYVYGAKMSHPATVTSFGSRLASGKSAPSSSGSRGRPLTKTFTGGPSVAALCWKLRWLGLVFRMDQDQIPRLH